MKFYYLILLSALYIQCSSPKESTSPEGTSNTTETNQGTFTKKFYNGSDQIKFEGHLLNEKPNGFCKHYHENGKLKIEANYQFGNLEGFYKSYFSNGRLKEEGHFKQGEKTGYWKSYDENGNVLKEGEV